MIKELSSKMINQEHCKKTMSFLGSLLPASDTDWNNLHELLQQIYKDINTLHDDTSVYWEVTPMMQYQFELTAEQLPLSLCVDFIIEMYNTKNYIEGLLPMIDKESDTAAFRIVLHGLRCAILFLEHQMYLNDGTSYINMKKYLHV